MIDTTTIKVAFAANNEYAPHLEIALFSLLKNNQSHTFAVYILSSDITKKSEKKLRNICDHFGNATLEIVVMGGRFDSLKTLAHFSRDIYSRYLLPEILSRDERVLYLDGDILVTGDISELYFADLSNSYVAGIRDHGIAKPMFKDYLRILGLKGADYINSGVLVMNLDKIRAEGKVRALLDKTEELADIIQHPDQDVINIIFKNKITHMENVWNFQDEDRKNESHKLEDVRIIHYTTEKKPWNTPNELRTYNTAAHELYEQYEAEYFNALGFEKKVSIIIPVYNTPKEFLDECFKSVLGQTYQNTEVVVIDDGSNRETAEYLDCIARADKRVTLQHIKNGGSNNARHVGFKASKGDYIVYVDGDDTIEKNTLHKLFRAIVSDEADIALCEYWDGVIQLKFPTPWMYGIRVINGQDEVSHCRYLEFPEFRTITSVVWSKMYARKVIEGVDWSFSDYMMTEDEFMSIQVYANASKVTLVRDQLYYYRQVTSSKEANYPHENIHAGKKMPMIQTARDLYEKTKALYEEKGIEYNDDELLIYYIYFSSRCAYMLSRDGKLDAANKKELDAQKVDYLDRILASERVLDIQKVRAVLTYSAPSYREFMNNLEDTFKDAVFNRDLALQGILGELTALRAEKEQFMGIKRSARLFAGNVKRRLRVRTRVRNLLAKYR